MISSTNPPSLYPWAILLKLLTYWCDLSFCGQYFTSTPDSLALSDRLRTPIHFTFADVLSSTVLRRVPHLASLSCPIKKTGCWGFTSLLHLMWYQDSYRLVTVCTHGDLLVLRYWEIRPLGTCPNTWLSHVILTLSQPMLALSYLFMRLR